jgi:serine/threonine-protein kinase
MSSRIKIVTVSPELHPGYRLRRRCGSGGFGEVWEAEGENGIVALKFVRARDATQEIRSIQVVQELPHAHLIRIHRAWCVADYLVVAMELADGSLADLLEVYRSDLGTPFPPDHILPLLAQAASALEFLNNRQHLINGQWATIQHCDVTPTNMLLFGNAVKLGDFGLTTTLTARQKLHYRAGTPAYAAPEVFQGLVSDHTDQYALAVCYCLLRGGRFPFLDTPPTFRKDYTRPAPDLSMLSPLERPAIARALAMTPQDRWPTCRTLIAELQKTTSTLQGAVDASTTERRREPRYQPRQCIDCEVMATLGNQAWETELQNISAGGARLRIVQPECDIKPGRLLELVLTHQHRGLSVAVKLRLAHTSRLPSGDYEVGGAFARPLMREELAALSQDQP